MFPVICPITFTAGDPVVLAAHLSPIGGKVRKTEGETTDKGVLMIDPAVLEHIRIEGLKLIKAIDQHKNDLSPTYHRVVPDMIRVFTSQSYIEELAKRDKGKPQENTIGQKLRLVK